MRNIEIPRDYLSYVVTGYNGYLTQKVNSAISTYIATEYLTLSVPAGIILAQF